MDGWKERLLNQAGKKILIKAIIQAIPTYAMSILRFPKRFTPEYLDFGGLGVERREALIGGDGMSYLKVRRQVV